MLEKVDFWRWLCLVVPEIRLDFHNIHFLAFCSMNQSGKYFFQLLKIFTSPAPQWVCSQESKVGCFCCFCTALAPASKLWCICFISLICVHSFFSCSLHIELKFRNITSDGSTIIEGSSPLMSKFFVRTPTCWRKGRQRVTLFNPILTNQLGSP